MCDPSNSVFRLNLQEKVIVITFVSLSNCFIFSFLSYLNPIILLIKILPLNAALVKHISVLLSSLVYQDLMY